MPDQIEDLWPAELPNLILDPEPVVFLKEQAKIDWRKNEGRVQGGVEASISKGEIYYVFYLSSRAALAVFQAYRFKILSISHAITRGRDEPFPLTAQASFGDPATQIQDMTEFKAWLRTVLSSQNVIAVVGNLQRDQRDLIDVVRSQGT